ncbi:hypothetical protein MLD38_015235 [Melastoma candidum]|uniref:Uncharacterized protein n=1 Tax=Melastoma candidum TaxID=119954 RepID=A0ACB9RFI3_9MYRT|nr:hypothetical protein MLD38_015235 [Melastoma candidum]
MVNALVERATSDMLIGPDWARNVEICDILNRDPGQAKDVVKGIKKRMGSKNPKVQLLALTLLETIVKNCGDIVLMHVAERDIIHDMAKIVKKKPDIHVKEKILSLIATWREAFGNPRTRYPQNDAAYQELLRAGAVFPHRRHNSAPLSSYPQNVQNSESQQEASETSSEAEYPTLSLTEIQNARGIMDVLSEMLNAIDPENKEGIRQEVVVDLVEQCRTYKLRVVHLVNSTSDESLLRQGLALNDELQRLLARHEAISSGTLGMSMNKGDNGLLVDVGDSDPQPVGRSPSDATASSLILNQLLLPAPPSSSGPPSNAEMDPKIDLLSGGDFSSPKAEPSLALVPAGVPQDAPSQTQQNALVLFDMFSDGNTPLNPINTQNGNPTSQSNPSSPQFQQQPSLQPPQFGVYANGNSPTAGFDTPDRSFYAQGSGTGWNGQIAPPQQPSSPAYGAGGSLPPPPWEAPGLDSPHDQPTQLPLVAGTPSQSPYTVCNDQNMRMYMAQVAGGNLPGMNGHQYMQPNQMMGIAPQPMQGGGPFMGMMMVPQQMQVGATGYMYPQQMYGGQAEGAAYGYSPQGLQYVDQRMYGLSVRDEGRAGGNNTSSSQSTVPHYAPPMKPSKPEDKLFGDLVDMARAKKSAQD